MKHLLVLSLIYGQLITAKPSESIIADLTRIENSISGQAVEDVGELLGNACDCTVKMNEREASVRIILPADLPPFEKNPPHMDAVRSNPFFTILSS
ncbi:MAG: hypothetical protein GY751_14185 [Bacteroidetes bacterium]|nr:hypothetical protein [Bacteroidota bacterium]